MLIVAQRCGKKNDHTTKRPQGNQGGGGELILPAVTNELDKTVKGHLQSSKRGGGTLSMRTSTGAWLNVQKKWIGRVYALWAGGNERDTTGKEKKKKKTADCWNRKKRPHAHELATTSIEGGASCC